MEEKNEFIDRIGVSLPQNLLNKFDRIIRGRGYSSRSEGIRDAIRTYIAEHEWMANEKGEKVGNITYFFNSYDSASHGERQAGDEIVKAISSFQDIVISKARFLLGGKRVFEVITVIGKAERIKELAESIMSRKGITNLKMSLTHRGV